MKERTQNTNSEVVPEAAIPAEKVTKRTKKTEVAEVTESTIEEPGTEPAMSKRELKANCKEAQKTYHLAKWNVKVLRKKYQRLLKKQNSNYKNSIFNIEISIFEAKEDKRELKAIYKSAKLQLKNRKKG